MKWIQDIKHLEWQASSIHKTIATLKNINCDHLKEVIKTK